MTHQSVRDLLAERVAELAAERRARAAEAARRPSELQETVAHDLERLLETDVDPLDVVEARHEYPYDICTYEWFGITIIGHYLWGGRDQRYHRTSSPWAAERRRRFGRRQRRPVDDLGDFEGWL